MARRRNSNRRRRGSFGFLYRLLSTLVICAAIVAALTLFFRVDTVVITGQERYTEEELRDATGIQTGDNLYLLLNKKEVVDRMMTELPYLKSVRINRKLPDTLLIEVEECGTPLAVIQDGSAWLVSPGDETGGKLKIVEQTETAAVQDCGVIDGCTLLAPSVGGQLALATEYAGQQSSLQSLLFALEAQGVLDQVDGVHLSDATVLTMDYAGRFTVKMPYGADYTMKVKNLLMALDTGAIQDNMTGTFDMRGDDGKINFIQNVR